MPPAWFSKYLNYQPNVGCFELEDTSISYRHWPNKEKPGLLFVHGHAAHARWWDFIAPAFKDSHNVAAIDLSGSGDSAHRRTYSTALFAREIIGCIDASEMKSTTVVGHSFGGTITRTAAYMYPEKIRAIVLADSHIPTQKAKPRSPVTLRDKRRYYQSLSEGIKRFRLRPPQPRPQHFIFNYIAEHSLRKTERGYCFKYDSRIFEKMTTEEDLPIATEMLRNIAMPIGLIYGKMSRFFSPPTIEALAKLIPPELSFGLAEAHHHVFLDQPEKFIEKLGALLSVMPTNTLISDQ